ncbi:type IV pilus secretin PilQ family protein [Endozoicomonas sp. GU-1]|uniref:type IV pilus secretin PilQ n=1 Tax=Endozoicomonas sp. GU-1 TaxID=3009078 RepID=UPI0022B46953|nr:type IV pilus secretin PilQ family protein [Endozoicomonas sp. GU-1]WBA82979.1 type IV pilus secretin PilQ family protein [Endozoicomonas sp. GU-1]WBA85905.1 type IV pilus secretin PilQ family protein [Endozoicomonas sp. GU-1]
MNISPLLQARAVRGLLYTLLAMLPISAWGVTLKNIDTAALPGEMVEIRLSFDGAAPVAHGYSIEKPPRISIDLPFTRSELPKYNEIGFNNAKSVTVLEAGDRTRLVINLQQPTRFSTQADGRTLSIYLGENNSTTAVQRELPQRNQSSYQAAEMRRGITDIDFQRGDDGEGEVIIALSDARIPMDMNEQGGRIRLEFQGNVLPQSLRNRLDVIDFATPIKFIDAAVEDGNSIITIEPKGEFEYLAYQTDNLLTVSVKAPDPKDRSRRKAGLSYKGDKLSLNFQDIEVRAVLQLIADFTDLNLVASDTVGGNVTLRLQNVPWDQALDIVLKAKGLDKRLEGNVLTVAPAAEIAAREREQLENEKQIRELAPVYTDLVQINYADAEEIATVLKGAEGASLLTERGSVQVVARTNSLLIKDTQAKLDELRALIDQLDIPIRQVMIEARIVTLSSNFQEELGVRWSGSKNDVLKGDNRDLSIGGGQDDDVFTDLSVTGGASSAIAIGFSTNGGTILNLELSALLSDGGGEVISQPKVITADKKTAIIKSGKEIPYEEKTSSGATSVAFKDAVLGLEVTPQITPDGRVIMDIKINNDDTTDQASNNVPIISTNEITTQVLVEDGETVVLGGVFKQSKKQGVIKVPVLGDIPLVGGLFRNKTESDDKEELLVFITPRIITEGVSLR